MLQLRLCQEICVSLFYVFEFTGLPELPVYKEGDLEDALTNNLSQFFLELGKGFTYVES